MHFFQSSSSLSALIVVALALLPSTQAANDIDAFFQKGNRYFPDRDDMNGCKSHVQVLTDSYKEASVLTTAAVNALKVLGAPRPDANTDANGHKSWVAKADTLLSFFKIVVDPTKGGPVTASAGDWADVNKVFNYIKNGFDTDKAQPIQNPALYCNTDGWTWLKASDPDPNVAGKLISDRKVNGQTEFPNGVWHFNKNYKKQSGSNPGQPGGHGICKPGLFAVTSVPLDVITFCPLGFSHLKATLPASVKTGDNIISDVAQITYSWTWVHELSHFYGARDGIGLSGRGVIDQPVDVPAKPPATGTVKKPAYGAPNVIKLAVTGGSALATHNADSYGTFAVAMHFDQFNWKDGTAQPL